MNRFSLLAIPMLMTAACSRQQTVLAARASQEGPTAVHVETVAIAQIPDIYRASGTVRACQIAAIAARIAANIVEVRVQSGDHVHAGQPLVVLDRRDLEANLRRADAARAEAEDAFVETEYAIASARASVELARATHKRFKDLLAKD